MPNNTVVMPLDADRIYLDHFIYEAREVMYERDASSVDLDIGYTYDGGLIDGYFVYYLAVVFRVRHAGNQPLITASLSLNGEFTPRFGSFPNEASEEKIEEWIGANAISLMYAKAANIVEQQLNASPIEHIALPVINPYTVWKNGEIEDGEFWADVDEGEIVKAFSDMIHSESVQRNSKDAINDLQDENGSEETEDKDASEQTIDRSENRGTQGIWTMKDDGEFELNEPYKTKLMNARFAATQAWHDALISYLEENSAYSWDELHIELLRRNRSDTPKAELVDEFILEALSGDL